MNLKNFNLALVVKWWWRLLTRLGGVMQTLLRKKYGPRGVMERQR